MEDVKNGTPKLPTITVTYDPEQTSVVGIAADGLKNLPFIKAVLGMAVDDLDAQIRFRQVAMLQAKMQEQHQAEMVRSALQLPGGFKR